MEIKKDSLVIESVQSQIQSRTYSLYRLYSSYCFSFVCFLLITLYFGSTNAVAQTNPIQIYSLPQKVSVPQNRARSTARRDVLPALSLPFWDDFSEADENNQPLEAYWVENKGVLVETGIGINSPSLNVATFDAADENGDAGVDQQTNVRSDELTSQCIDLSLVDDANNNTIYLSFFYEFKGYGESPDSMDRLILEFKDSDENWVEVWAADVTPLAEMSSDAFPQVIIHVDPSKKFVHAGFQFRFANFNRLNGNFDTWHVDYVYMNENRDPQDLTYRDRTVSDWNQGLLKTYTAVPFSQFSSPSFNLADELTTGKIEVNNLGEDLQTLAITSYLVDKSDPKTRLVLLADKKVDRLLTALERRVLEADMPTVSDLRNAITKPMTLQHIFYFDKVDLGLVKETVNGVEEYYANIDYAKNDSIRREFAVQDYFAYDDGTAEFGAGINQTGGELLVEFDVPQGDELTAVDIYFPSITANITTIPIDITVRSALDDNANSLLYKESERIRNSTKKNEFIRYWLNTVLQVQGKIYIGITQFSDVNLAIGLDKNTDTSSSIYYNVLGSWEQNTLVKGSLMIRPVFGTKNVITNINPHDKENNVDFYPNPVSKSISFNQKIKKVKIYNLMGVLQITKDGLFSQLDCSFLKSGTYLMQATAIDGQISTKRIIKK